MPNLNTQKQEGKKTTIIAIGFMVFATFFGAGNLIFPPYLGFVGGGSSWIIGFIFFIIFDTVLGILGLAASGKFPQVEIGVFYRPGRVFMIIIGAIATFIGSILVVIPRTALTSYQIFWQPVTAGGFENVQTTTGFHAGPAIFIFVYLALATFCAIRPTKVVDVVGKWLTPALLVVLIVLIIVGIATNSGTGVRPEALPTSSPSIIAFGIVQGLQTFDAATGTIIAVIIIASLLGKGISKSSDQTRTIIRSGFVAAICLVIIYLGLTILGLLYSNDPTLLEMYGSDAGLGQPFLLNYIISSNLGFAGTVIFGLAVLLATFTTAIGCVGLTSEYYRRITGGRISYPAAVLICMVISLIIGVALSTTASGVDTLLNLTIPVLLITAPITVTLIILNMFTDQIRNDNVYRGATIGAGIWGLVWGLAYFFAVTTGTAGSVPWLYGLAGVMFGPNPYSMYFGLGTDTANIGVWNFLFQWTGDLGYVIPAVVGGVIGISSNTRVSKNARTCVNTPATTALTTRP
jgi:LIVCS family branched-chain amino acid:cation transporter